MFKNSKYCCYNEKFKKRNGQGTVECVTLTSLWVIEKQKISQLYHPKTVDSVKSVKEKSNKKKPPEKF